MKTVREILDAKGYEVHAVDAGSTVFEALRLMADKNIGAVLVVEGEKPAGIMTERDYARKVILHDKDSRQTPVREIMVWNPLCVRPEQTVEDGMKLMTTKRFRHLPVTDNDKLIGMISIGDVVKAVISDQQFVIEQLEHYITGG